MKNKKQQWKMWKELVELGLIEYPPKYNLATPNEIFEQSLKANFIKQFNFDEKNFSLFEKNET